MRRKKRDRERENKTKETRNTHAWRSRGSRRPQTCSLQKSGFFFWCVRTPPCVQYIYIPHTSHYAAKTSYSKYTLIHKIYVRQFSYIQTATILSGDVDRARTVTYRSTTLFFVDLFLSILGFTIL